MTSSLCNVLHFVSNHSYLCLAVSYHIHCFFKRIRHCRLDREGFKEDTVLNASLYNIGRIERPSRCFIRKGPYNLDKGNDLNHKLHADKTRLDDRVD